MIWLILILAAVLRLILINQSLWLDEAIQVLAVENNGYLSLITQYSLGDFHPPLYHLILKFWTGIFGISEVATRSLSVLVGVATVFVIFLIGKEIKNEKFGLIAGLFLATAPLHIYYSQEARMYATAAFFIVVLIYFFIKLLKIERFFYWFFFTLILILTLYTDYLPYLILLPLNFYVFWQFKNLTTKFLVRWFTSQLLALIFLLPWVPFLIRQIEIGTGVATKVPIWREVVGGFSLKAIPQTAAKFIAGRISSFNKVLYAVVLILPFLYFSFLILKAFLLREKERFLLLFWLVLPVFAGWLISAFIPVYSYFRFIFVLPSLYFIIAAGILSFKNIKTQTVLIILVLLINLVSQIIFWLNPRFWREDWRGAVSHIEANSQDNVAVVFVTLGQTAPYEYYVKSVPFYGPEGWQDKNLTTIWLSRYVQPIFDPKDNLKKEIELAGYIKIEEKDFNGVTFWRYDRLLATSDLR